MDIDYSKIIYNAIKRKGFSQDIKNGISLITYSLKNEKAVWNDDSVIVPLTGIVGDSRIQIYTLFKSLSCEVVECTYTGPNGGLFKLVMPLIQSFTMFDEGFQGELVVSLNPYMAETLIQYDKTENQ